jgi:hypothetical protein
MSLPIDAIKVASEKHPKPSDIRFQYGTAGFRTLYVPPIYLVVHKVIASALAEIS